MTDYLRPHRPPYRPLQHYEALKPENTVQLKRKDLFTVTITAATNNGGNMEKQALDEQRFLIDLIFKPIEPGLKLRPEESQLLLSYIGEILMEIEAEEQLIVSK